MNDDFLYRARPPVRQEFAEALYERITQREERKRRAPLLKLSKVVLLIILAFSVMLMVSPSIRAAVLEEIKRIGGFTFDVAEEYPYTGITQFNTLFVSLDKAQSDLPFRFGVPAWAPEGFVPNDQVSVLLPAGDSDLSHATNVYLTWLGPSGTAKIWLVAQPSFLLECPECAVPVGPESLEELEVNGSPASLVRGAWNDQTQQWDSSGGLINLRWSGGDIIYLLTGIEPMVSVDDLVRMAESIK